MQNLTSELSHLITPQLFLNQKEYKDFFQLVKSGKLTKNENSEYHCCVFFIPFNPKTKEIFIVHHKKAKQWVVPGGHIEKGELLKDAVKREAKEELGIDVKEIDEPFLFSVMYIHNDGQPCKAHYDSWYLLQTTKVHVDLTEFNETKWVTKKEAKKNIRHKTYLKALEIISELT